MKSRQDLDALTEKVRALIQKKPEKAVTILQEWAKQPAPASKSTTTPTPITPPRRKKAA